jgi:hypothetical protein
VVAQCSLSLSTKNQRRTTPRRRCNHRAITAHSRGRHRLYHRHNQIILGSAFCCATSIPMASHNSINLPHSNRNAWRLDKMVDAGSLRRRMTVRLGLEGATRGIPRGSASTARKTIGSRLLLWKSGCGFMIHERWSWELLVILALALVVYLRLRSRDRGQPDVLLPSRNLTEYPI